MTLYGFVTEMETLHYDESPKRPSPERVMDMFQRGGSFRGAAHAYTTGHRSRDAWVLFDDGEPVAAASRDDDEIEVGPEAVEEAKSMDRMTFTRLKDPIYDSIIEEAEGTAAMTGSS